MQILSSAMEISHFLKPPVSLCALNWGNPSSRPSLQLLGCLLGIKFLEISGGTNPPERTCPGLGIPGRHSRPSRTRTRDIHRRCSQHGPSHALQSLPSTLSAPPSQTSTLSAPPSQTSHVREGEEKPPWSLCFQHSYSLLACRNPQNFFFFF